MQMEFSNRDSNGSTTGCVLKDTDTQPTFTISIVPNPPVHGSSAKFTANVTDPAGVSAVQWTFGDGTSATGNPVNHTYAAAGTKTLTVIVTDNHGNEKKVVQTVTVS
jgi:PKD repeat protein